VHAPFDIPLYGKPHWRAVACFLLSTATLESVEELDIAMLSLSVLSDGQLKEGRESRVDYSQALTEQGIMEAWTIVQGELSLGCRFKRSLIRRILLLHTGSLSPVLDMLSTTN
jgi:hypothetical protein